MMDEIKTISFDRCFLDVTVNGLDTVSLQLMDNDRTYQTEQKRIKEECMAIRDKIEIIPDVKCLTAKQACMEVYKNGCAEDAQVFFGDNAQLWINRFGNIRITDVFKDVNNDVYRLTDMLSNGSKYIDIAVSIDGNESTETIARSLIKAVPSKMDDADVWCSLTDMNMDGHVAENRVVKAEHISDNIPPGQTAEDLQNAVKRLEEEELTEDFL